MGSFLSKSPPRAKSAHFQPLCRATFARHILLPLENRGFCSGKLALSRWHDSCLYKHDQCSEAYVFAPQEHVTQPNPKTKNYEKTEDSVGGCDLCRRLRHERRQTCRPRQGSGAVSP